jgi:6-phosphogluconolactonase
VEVTPDGARVLVAVRGSDVLAVHAVVPAPDGGAPALEHLADTPVGGAWPRHFAVLRQPDGAAVDAPGGDGPAHDVVVVANQEDDPSADAQGDGPTSNLALVRVARADGKGEVLDVLALPAPACVVEVPRA